MQVPTGADYVADSGVDQLISNFKQQLASRGETLTVSDVTDQQGHQYVDLVQEGGGVLGIALVGYTYVLEKMGIRFFSLAGTSAGSINAMLLACSGNKEDEKSTGIIDHLARLKMFCFVDGKPTNSRFTKWIKKLIQHVLLGGQRIKRMVKIVLYTSLVFFILSFASFIFNFFIPPVAKWLGLVAGVALLVLATLAILGITRFRHFSKNGYGLNCGNEFHKWINTLIESCAIENDPSKGQITNLSQFSKHFMRVPALQVKPDVRRTNNKAPYMPMLTIITCDIIAERKIEFPQMWDLYWNKAEDVHPGDFVRASMSIPVFFETFTLKEIRKKSAFAKWDIHLNWQNAEQKIPDSCQFIDGGTLSNFPINVFYNPAYPVPRMPTLGIRLQDGILDGANRSNNSFFRYLASLFATIRFNFDRDFITKNRAYTMGVKAIDVRKFSWLNFFMTDKEKIALFKKGAEAAIEFLNTFNWENYKAERLRNHQLQEVRFENPNNMDVQPFKREASPEMAFKQ